MGEPVPVYGLFGEKPGVFEAEGLQMKGKVPVFDAPLPGQMKEFPFAAAFGTSVIVSVLLFPAAVFSWCIPDDLRVGTYQDIIAPAFQLLTAGGVYYFIIFPCIGCPHYMLILSVLHNFVQRQFHGSSHC